jgi:predicted Zn-dependent protease
MATAAIAAVAWLALSYRSERLLTDGERVALKGENVPPAEAKDALRKARDARTLQPDSRPKLLEWLLLRFLRRNREAEALILDMVRSEPANAQAWFVLAENASNPTLAREARRRFRELQPPRPERR